MFAVRVRSAATRWGERGREERRRGRANRLTAAAVAAAGNLVPISAAAVVGASIATTSTVDSSCSVRFYAVRS